MGADLTDGVPRLYAHPFSSYCQKALIAFYETGAPFTLRLLSPEDPSAGAELADVWPLQKFPVLVAEGRTWLESSVIVEWVDARHPRPSPLIPREPEAALEVRMRDRLFDSYVMTPMQAIVANAMRPEASRDPHGVDQARALLDRSYDWLEGEMAAREWACGEHFTLADCAAAPALFYADWAHPIGERPHLAAYRARLLARPSFARCVEEARPYRFFFPLGAPDRD